jgi:hypothetical protein
MAAVAFLTPRGHKRSINMRVPSDGLGALYARFNLTFAATTLLPITIAPKTS